MNQQKAARLRAASRWIGYGGVLLCAALAAIWYIVCIVVQDQPFDRLEIAGIKTLPAQLLGLIAAALFLIIVAVLIRIAASRVARAGENEELTDNLDEEEESVYEEEPLPPMETGETLPTDTGADDSAGEPAEVIPETAAPQGTVIASFDVRLPAEDPARAAKRAEQKAKIRGKISKIKTAAGEKVGKIVPKEKLDKIKKNVETAKKAAKIAIPVAIACVVVVKVAKKRRKKKHEKEKARNREQFYQWLG